MRPRGVKPSRPGAPIVRFSFFAQVLCKGSHGSIVDGPRPAGHLSAAERDRLNRDLKMSAPAVRFEVKRIQGRRERLARCLPIRVNCQPG